MYNYFNCKRKWRTDFWPFRFFMCLFEIKVFYNKDIKTPDASHEMAIKARNEN